MPAQARAAGGLSNLRRPAGPRCYCFPAATRWVGRGRNRLSAASVALTADDRWVSRSGSRGTKIRRNADDRQKQ